MSVKVSVISTSLCFTFVIEVLSLGLLLLPPGLQLAGVRLCYDGLFFYALSPNNLFSVVLESWYFIAASNADTNTVN